MSKIYTRKTNLIEVMRWLREEGGNRGVLWETTGGKNLSIEIKDSSLELAYIFEWEWRRPDVPPNVK